MNKKKLNTDNQPISDEARQAGRRWAAVIVLGLSIVVVVNLYVAWLVGGDGFPLVSENYYQDALEYDRIVDVGKTISDLGLKLIVDSSGNVKLISDDHQVVPNNVTLHYYRPNNPGADFVTTAQLSPEGFWVPATLPPLTGRWDITLQGRWRNREIEITQKWYNKFEQ